MYRFLLISFLAVLWVRISLATNTGDPCADDSDCQGKNAVCEDPGDGIPICRCPDGFTATGVDGNGDCEECNYAQDCADKGYGNKQDVTCVFKACQCMTGFLQRPPSKTCVSAAECAALTDPLNGGITYDPAGSPTYETTTATYSCNPSYTLVGTASTTCTISTDWSPNTAPVCTYECEQDASVPTDGSVVYGADTLDGSEATYQCDSGFLLSGSPTATCSEASSGWVGTPPVCNQIIDGVWGTWESWGACDQTCGAGTQTRSRPCNDPAPANGGAQCAADGSVGSELQACNDGACPVDGVWGTWECWGACDQTCGAGTQTRSRLCNSPEQANGGAHCTADGSAGSETQNCNDGACPACPSSTICRGQFSVCEYDAINNVSKCVCLPGFYDNNGDCIQYKIFMHAIMMFCVVMTSIAILCVVVGVIISVVIICIPGCRNKCGPTIYAVEKEPSEADTQSYILPLHERRASGPYETLGTRVDNNPEHPYYTTETITEYESIDDPYVNEASN